MARPVGPRRASTNGTSSPNARLGCCWGTRSPSKSSVSGSECWRCGEPRWPAGGVRTRSLRRWRRPRRSARARGSARRPGPCVCRVDAPARARRPAAGGVLHERTSRLRASLPRTWPYHAGAGAGRAGRPRPAAAATGATASLSRRVSSPALLGRSLGLRDMPRTSSLAAAPGALGHAVRRSGGGPVAIAWASASGFGSMRALRPESASKATAARA
jgi:hypothetical protein